MNRRAWAVTTALVLTATTACTGRGPQADPVTAAVAMPEAAAPDGDTPPDHPTLVVCATILGTMSNAILEGRATGDRTAIRAGYDAYRRKAAEAMGAVGSRQAIGSSYAFYDSLTATQLSAASAMCLAAVDRPVTEDDWW